MKRKNNLLVLIVACLMLGACNEAKTGTAAPATSTTPASASEVTTTTAETTTAGTTTTTTAEKEKVDNVVEPEQSEYTADGIECDPIDKSLDCEQLMLDKADKLHEMISGWCNVDKSVLAFEVGDQCEGFQGWDGAYKVVSDNVNTYADFKALYENDIYGAYIDTEGTHIEERVVCGYDALYFEHSDGSKCLAWDDGDYIFELQFNFDYDTAIQIAESIEEVE